MARQDQYSVTFIVDDQLLGVFDTLSGGEVDSEETTYRKGAMGAKVSLGGPSMTGNITVSRLFERGVDTETIHWLFSRVGKGVVTGTRTPLDQDGNVKGRAVNYRGTLKRVELGEHDSNSADADVYELEATVEGLPY